MKCLIAILFAVVLAVDGKAMPDGDVETQETGTQPSQLSDFLREAKTRIDALGTQIQEHLNLPNQDQFLNTIKEQSDNFTHSLNEYIKTKTEEIKSNNPELETLWTNIKTKMSEAIDKMAISPETTEQVNQLRAKFQEGVQAIVKESENAAKSIQENSGKVQEDIAKITKQAVDIAVQASQNLNNQLQQAVTESQKS